MMAMTTMSARRESISILTMADIRSSVVFRLHSFGMERGPHAMRRCDGHNFFLSFLFQLFSSSSSSPLSTVKMTSWTASPPLPVDYSLFGFVGGLSLCVRMEFSFPFLFSVVSMLALLEFMREIARERRENEDGRGREREGGRFEQDFCTLM